jgi:hypothetical protein
MARNRGLAVAITSNTKMRMSQEMGLTSNMNEEERKDKITNYIEEKVKNEGKFLNRRSTLKPDNHIDIVPPQYMDIKKEYYTKNEKPILFHEKARIIDSLDKKFVGDIETYSQHVDFQTFLAQFKNEDELSRFEIQDLINIDYEKLGELKEKAVEYTEAASSIVQGSNTQGSDDLLVFFCEKLNDIKRNEINIQLFVNNIEKVDSLLFSNDKTAVYFIK